MTTDDILDELIDDIRGVVNIDHQDCPEDDCDRCAMARVIRGDLEKAETSRERARLLGGGK